MNKLETTTITIILLVDLSVKRDCLEYDSEVGVWSLCQRMFSHSYCTVYSCRNIQCCIVTCTDFFSNSFSVIGRSVVLSEHLCRPVSWSVPQSLSLSCASLKCNHPIFIWGSRNTVSGVTLIFHPFLRQMASLNSCLFSAGPHPQSKVLCSPV